MNSDSASSWSRHSSLSLFVAYMSFPTKLIFPQGTCWLGSSDVSSQKHPWSCLFSSLCAWSFLRNRTQQKATSRKNAIYEFMECKSPGVRSNVSIRATASFKETWISVPFSPSLSLFAFGVDSFPPASFFLLQRNLQVICPPPHSSSQGTERPFVSHNPHQPQQGSLIGWVIWTTLWLASLSACSHPLADQAFLVWRRDSFPKRGLWKQTQQEYVSLCDQRNWLVLDQRCIIIFFLISARV